MKALRPHLCSAPLLLALFAAPAWAGRWLPVVEGTARAVYLDTAGATREGDLVRAWVREVYTQEQRSEQVGVLFYSANSLVSYDCEKRLWAPLFRVFYGGDGTELRRVSLDAAELPALAAPGSVQETLLERACRPPARPAKARTRAADVKLAQAEAALQRTAVSASGEAAGAATPAQQADAATAKPQQPAADAEPGKAASADVAAHATPAGKAARTDGARPRARQSPVRTAAYEPQRARTRRDAAKPAPQSEPAAHAEVRWSYSGAGGPEQWGRLKPEYESCATGQRQSPIDIRQGARLELQPIVFDYKPAPLRVVDTGHTVQVNYAEGSTITVAGERFELEQLHFHKPAEERIDGRSFDMVAHLVHRNPDGRLAVLAVLFEAREQAHPFLRALWPHLPLEQGREVAPKDVTIDVNALLPEVRTYFAYIGSLTTPPCSEGVLWLVLKTPVEIAPEQVAVFGKLYSMNARPLQPAHGRLIKESM